MNESALTPLRGNTHPLAQARYDQGIAPPDLPMARMLLVLKRSDTQESALDALLDAQQESGKFSQITRQWLSPRMRSGNSLVRAICRTCKPWPHGSPRMVFKSV